MVELHIKIRKRIARLAYGENFVSYNEDYKVIFDFDKEWDNIENKVARFIFGENYIDCPFNGNEVKIPLIKDTDTLEIGVYSDDLYTTTPVKFKVLKSIKDEEKIEILVPELYPEIEELNDEDLIKVYDKSEEKTGISPLKNIFDKMKVAIDDALAAAKESGDFDGANGITPTIGDNGNWFLGNTDTEKPSRGDDGKSAYSYAQDGGYTGTEAEFAVKLAAEKLPNPYPLTFTGAVEETYDGSSAKTITIPSGGGGEKEWTVLVNQELSTETPGSFSITGLDSFTEFYAEWDALQHGTDNSTNSGMHFWINGIQVSASPSFCPVYAPSKTPLYGWTMAKYNGLRWLFVKSQGSISKEKTGITSNMTTQYYPSDITAPATEVYVGGSGDYAAVSGHFRLWGR